MGSTLLFAARAEDFSGNTASAEVTTTLTDLPDTTPPQLTLTVQGVQDLAGYALASPFTASFTSLDTLPPPPPPAGKITATIPGAEGKTTVTASQGTAGTHDQVWILNTTRGASTPALPEADGSFSAIVEAGMADKLQIKITDPAGNETVIPVERFSQTNPDGSVSAVIGADGGKVEGPGGVAVDVPAGAFPDGAVVSIKPVAETDFPVQLTDQDREFFSYNGGIQLDLGRKTPETYLNLSIPTRGDEAGKING